MIIGIIDDKNLLDIVSSKSFDEKVEKAVIRLKKIQHNESIEKLTKIIKKNGHLLVFKKNTFFGIVSMLDLLWYIKREKRKC